jgi:hypothetical protein
MSAKIRVAGWTKGIISKYKNLPCQLAPRGGLGEKETAPA